MRAKKLSKAKDSYLKWKSMQLVPFEFNEEDFKEHDLLDESIGEKYRWIHGNYIDKPSQRRIKKHSRSNRRKALIMRPFGDIHGLYCECNVKVSFTTPEQFDDLWAIIDNNEFIKNNDYACWTSADETTNAFCFFWDTKSKYRDKTFKQLQSQIEKLDFIVRVKPCKITVHELDDLSKVRF